MLTIFSSILIPHQIRWLVWTHEPSKGQSWRGWQQMLSFKIGPKGLIHEVRSTRCCNICDLPCHFLQFVQPLLNGGNDLCCQRWRGSFGFNIAKTCLPQSLHDVRVHSSNRGHGNGPMSGRIIQITSAVNRCSLWGRCSVLYGKYMEDISIYSQFLEECMGWKYIH